MNHRYSILSLVVAATFVFFACACEKVTSLAGLGADDSVEAFIISVDKQSSTARARVAKSSGSGNGPSYSDPITLDFKGAMPVDLDVGDVVVVDGAVYDDGQSSVDVNPGSAQILDNNVIEGVIEADTFADVHESPLVLEVSGVASYSSKRITTNVLASSHTLIFEHDLSLGWSLEGGISIEASAFVDKVDLGEYVELYITGHINSLDGSFEASTIHAYYEVVDDKESQDGANESIIVEASTYSMITETPLVLQVSGANSLALPLTFVFNVDVLGSATFQERDPATNTLTAVGLDHFIDNIGLGRYVEVRVEGEYDASTSTVFATKLVGEF